VDVDVDDDVDAEAEAECDGHGDVSWSLLSAVGIGRAPLGVVLMVALLLFGTVGFAAKLLLSDVSSSLLATVVAGASAMVVAVGLTGVTARTVGRLVPPVESYADAHGLLVGTVGTIELSTGDHGAIARVTDRSGTLHKIQCRSDGGSLEKGMRVLIIEHDADSDQFAVEQYNL